MVEVQVLLPIYDCCIVHLITRLLRRWRLVRCDTRGTADLLRSGRRFMPKEGSIEDEVLARGQAFPLKVKYWHIDTSVAINQAYCL